MLAILVSRGERGRDRRNNDWLCAGDRGGTGDDQLEPASLYRAVARRIWSLVLLFALLFVIAIRSQSSFRS
jgi:hypothetical protein